MESRLTHGLTYEAGLGQPRFAFRLTFVQEFVPGHLPGAETAVQFYDIDVPPVCQTLGGHHAHAAAAEVGEDRRVPGRQLHEMRGSNGLSNLVHSSVVGNFRAA